MGGGFRNTTGKPSLWATVLADLRERIAAGEFADRFPTDRDLMAHYGVSRHTVREAVRRLDTVQRRPRLGGQLRPANTLAILTRTITALGVPVEVTELDRIRRRSTPVATLLDLPPTRSLTVRRHLLRAEGRPLLLSELWSPGAAPATETTVAALLGLPGADPPDVEIRRQQTIPLVATQDVCAALDVAPGTAVFSIETLLDAGWHRAHIRPDRYPCALRFAP